MKEFFVDAHHCILEKFKNKKDGACVYGYSFKVKKLNI